jgi:hypothetical protein
MTSDAFFGTLMLVEQRESYFMGRINCKADLRAEGEVILFGFG